MTRLPHTPLARPTALLAFVVAASVIVAGCAVGLLSPDTPSGSSPVVSSGPGALASDAPGDSGAPEDNADPVPPSPSVPPFSPPPPLTPSAATAGLVLHVPILMYHRIIPPNLAGNSLPSLVVSPELFAAQMDALAAAGWHTITVAQLIADLAAGRRPAPQTFVITFDDGYDDGYSYALPILKTHHFVATYYVVAGRIGNAPGPMQALTPDHLRALAAAGMEIGNHTFSHVALPHYHGRQLTFQIVGASAFIHGLVGSAPTTLAYPFGRFDAAVEAEVQAAGIGIGLTTVEGARETWATRYETPRVRVGPGTSPGGLLSLVSRAWP